MHYIYHIPERDKIGVTTNVTKRMKEHKWTGTYQVVEQHEEAQTAGDREWELQDQHGYPRDHVHYAKLLRIQERSRSVAARQKRSNSLTGRTRSDSHRLNSMVLTLQLAAEIRSLYKEGNHTQRSLAKLYSVDKTTIHNILNNITYVNFE